MLTERTRRVVVVHLAVSESSVRKIDSIKAGSGGEVYSCDLAAIKTPADVPVLDRPVGEAAVAYASRPELRSLALSI